jgi:hypothetical protein
LRNESSVEMHKNKRDDIYKIIWRITKIILSLRLLMFLCMQINELHILFLFFKQIINDPLHANKWNENLTRKGLDAYKLQKHWRKIYWISITSKNFLVKLARTTRLSINFLLQQSSSASLWYTHKGKEETPMFYVVCVSIRETACMMAYQIY